MRERLLRRHQVSQARWRAQLVCVCGSGVEALPRRNIKGFMVQGGDPTGACGSAGAPCAARRAEAVRCAGTGRGGASIWGGKFPDELRDTLKARGGVASAQLRQRARG